MDPKKQKRKFKGIWIPAKLWLDDQITAQEKLFLAEISSLDGPRGCFASNEYFADFFQLSVRRVSEIINALVKKELIFSSIKKTAKGSERILSTHRKEPATPPLAGTCHTPTREPATPPLAGSCYHITKPIPIDNKRDNKEGVEKSSPEILGLDLLIADQKKFFMEQIQRIFWCTRGREAVTFANITRHMVEQVQEGKLEIGIFKDAIEWARIASASTARSKKAVFVAKIKKETGFRAQEKLL